MTILQEMGEQLLTPDSSVPIMLKSADGWDQVAAFVTLIVHCKMEIGREWQRQPIATTTQHPMLDLAIPPKLAISNPATKEEDDPGWSTSATSSINTQV